MFRHNLVSISVTALLLSGSFNSVANTQKPDEEDSVRSWGKWANPFETAAGDEFNGQALSFSRLSQSESGRNGDNEPDIRIETPPEPIDDPRLREYVSWGKGVYDPQSGVQNGTHRASINYTDGVSSKQFDVAIDNEQFQSGVLNADSFSTVYGDQYQASFFHSNDLNNDWTFLTLENGNGDYDRGYWYQDSWDGSRFLSNEGFFVKGLTSTLDAVNQLSSDVLAGNASALYVGQFLGNRGGVVISLDFGGATSWRGSFFPKNYTKFQATGSINGADLVGNITTSGVTGTVEASFFGSSAETIAGIAEANNGTSDFAEVFETQQLNIPSNP